MIDYNEYVEPVYPLSKREMFDENLMKPLLSDERFNRKDRERLSNYNKHRLTGGLVNVSYKFGSGCEETQLGRLFPDDGIGLQAFRFDMRNPLAKKFYWDIDMDNCHYRIAWKFCQRYKIQNTKINDYIENRDEWLKKLSNCRKKSKTEFLKILYGGNIKLFNENYEEVDGNLSTEGIKFLKELECEVKALADKLWTEYENLQKLKTGKEKKAINKKPNPKASLMSLLFQTEERKMLMFLDWLLAKHGRTLSVFIHDGGYVEKVESESQFPTEILRDCENHISNYFQIKMKLSQKSIDYIMDIKPSGESQYQIRKKEFETKNFFIKDIFVHMNEDGTLEYLKPSVMELQQKCNHYSEYDPVLNKSVRKFFFHEWLEDPDRAKFEKIDFIPDLNLCPSYTYNLFKGFQGEKYKPSREFTDSEVFIMVLPIIKHVHTITDGYSSYVLKWMASLIQNPTQRTEIALLLRDMGGLFTEGGGTGKSGIIDYFGNEILGEDYYYVVNDNRELYGNFNSQFEGKLLVVIDEANSKENHSNHDILKAKITAKKQNVNRKGINCYSVKDYTNYLFFTNNRNSIPIKQGNRRFAAFDTNPIMRGNEAYFKEFYAYINKTDIKWAFYTYLKRIVKPYETPIDFQTRIPTTSAYRDLRILNAPLYLKWLVFELKNGTLLDESVGVLYEKFKNWVKENKEGSENALLSLTAFGLLLKNEKEVSSGYDLTGRDMSIKRKVHGGIMKLKWNKDELIRGLKKLYLLDDYFEYIEMQEEDTDSEF